MPSEASKIKKEQKEKLIKKKGAKKVKKKKTSSIKKAGNEVKAETAINATVDKADDSEEEQLDGDLDDDDEEK